MRILFSSVLTLCSIVLAAQQIDYKGFPQWSWGKRDSTEYYLYTPSGTAEGKRLPIMLFLHGCCGEDYHASLRNAVDPPVRLWHDFGKNIQTRPIYILSPKTKAGWKQHFVNIKEVIDRLIADKKVDPQRVYISGFSMGAQGTWEFIERYPGYFAAAIPMGMDFKGKDPAVFKNIPIWAIRGDQDWWARHLGSQVRTIRAQSIDDADSAEWHTGLNPRLTNFEGMGHVVMWPAVSQLDLRNWILEKVNDGNAYPYVVIRSPKWKQEFKAGDPVEIQFDAADPDGNISKVEFLVNGKSISMSQSERKFRWTAVRGDNKVEVKVFDDRGKSATAEVIIRVNIPASIHTVSLPILQAGKYFSHSVSGSGNGMLRFLGTDLPEGIEISPEGLLSGIPVRQGEFRALIRAVDEDGDKAEAPLAIKVGKKAISDVVLTNVRDHNGNPLPVSVLSEGVSPHLRGDDEVTFSGDPGRYRNMLLIRTGLPDTIAKPFYLQFEADDDVTVFVAYEKLDNLYKSSIPAWLNDFRKEAGQLTTQYYYYDIFSKDFPKGKITLPDAEAKKNGVSNNYFVMVRKKQKS